MVRPSHVVLDPRLFWFAPPGTTIELSEPAMHDWYVQQVLSHGRCADVSTLLRQVARPQLQHTLQRIGRFLRPDIRAFWDEFLGHPH